MANVTNQGHFSEFFFVVGGQPLELAKAKKKPSRHFASTSGVP